MTPMQKQVLWFVLAWVGATIGAIGSFYVIEVQNPFAVWHSVAEPLAALYWTVIFFMLLVAIHHAWTHACATNRTADKPDVTTEELYPVDPHDR